MTYLSLKEYTAANDHGYLQAGDGATCMINDVLFECLTNINDPQTTVWVAWDSVDRSGLQSYVSQQEAYKLGLWRS